MDCSVCSAWVASPADGMTELRELRPEARRGWTQMPILGKWWIIAIGVLVVAALFIAMRFTNIKMQEGGQPSPEHLRQESGDDPGEQ